MRTPASAPRPVNPWVQLVALFGTFTAGGFIGLGLASWAAPGSGVAAGVSGLLLPASFAAGLLIWAGLDIVTAIVDLFRRGRGCHAAASSLATRSARWFVPIAVASASAGGLLVGILPGGVGPLASTLAYAAAGAGYGFAVGRLAALGYLPPPNPG